MEKTKVMSVVGARPNFMKVAPIISAIRRHNSWKSTDSRGFGTAEEYPRFQHVLVHTGQHYDALMSDSFFADLDLPQPDIHLGVGSGSHAVQTAEIMRKFEPVLLQEKPDVMIVVGDVNSTLACALVASKISFDRKGGRPLIAHVEAGLRSFDRSMPEEINRIVTDQLSDLLFVTEESGLQNLAHEGVPGEKVHLVGNTMIDSLLACKEKTQASTILDELGLRSLAGDNSSGRLIAPYALLTLHRPSNVDDRDAFLNIMGGLEELARAMPVVFPAHPRTQKRIAEFDLEHRFEWSYARREETRQAAVNGPGAVRLTEPLGYLDFLCLMSHSALVVTDSGGIQEETTCLGVPCVTVRENTERPVTVKVGTNVLAGVTKEGICAAIRRQRRAKIACTVPELWDGKSAHRILDVIIREVQSRGAAWNEGIISTPRGAGLAEEPGTFSSIQAQLAGQGRGISSLAVADANSSGALAEDSKR
jgi:UDP-N-acetylglucosamine 2-epimerase (non-hydrolysing)